MITLARKSCVTTFVFQLNTFTLPLETSKFWHQNYVETCMVSHSTGSVVCQHAKRSTYQARYFWDNSLVSSPPYPCASESGWVKVANDNYVSAFVDDNSRGTIELSGAFQMCFERSCAWRYNKLCVKVYLLCTALCNCGLCNRKWTRECSMQMNREIWVSLALFTLFL